MDPERAHDARPAGAAPRAGRAGDAADGRPERWRSRRSGAGSPIRSASPPGSTRTPWRSPPLMRLGFGFVETGTVTPRPQAGNPRPRLFRLAEDRAVINRMGFNNAGLDAYLRAARAAGRAVRSLLGANVGINKEGADPERDYPALVAAVAPHADYVVINVSSPNTPGLRDLQGEAQLRAILRAVAARVPERPPLLVKIAPDLADAGAGGPGRDLCRGGRAGADRLQHHDLPPARAAFAASPARPAACRGRRCSGCRPPCWRVPSGWRAGRLVLIGVGGVATGAQALAKIRAGASLVQLYTALRLCRSGADPAAQARTRCRAARRRLRQRAGRGGQATPNVWQNAADGTPVRLCPARRTLRRLHPRSVGRDP